MLVTRGVGTVLAAVMGAGEERIRCRRPAFTFLDIWDDERSFY